MFDAIWLVHYLRLWSNTHLLLWSENVENRNKKTVVNSRFRSKNLTNKSRGCTWKYKKGIQVSAILHWEIVFAWKTSLQRNYLRVYFNKLWMLMVINVTLTSWQLSAIYKTQMLLFNKLKSFLIFKTLSAKALNVFLKSLNKSGQFCFRVSTILLEATTHLIGKWSKAKAGLTHMPGGSGEGTSVPRKYKMWTTACFTRL